MNMIERITLKEAVLVGNLGQPPAARKGGVRYAKVLYGIREPAQDERRGDLCFFAFRVTGYISQYAYYSVEERLLRLLAANILCIDKKLPSGEPFTRCGHCGEPGVHGHTVIDVIETRDQVARRIVKLLHEYLEQDFPLQDQEGGR